MPGRSVYTSFGRFLVFSWRVLGRTSVLVLGGVRLFLPAFKPIPQTRGVGFFDIIVHTCPSNKFLKE